MAPTDATVLLLGETGTGKELLARTIHALSARRSRTMVRLNCAALPPTLIEAELFGRERGAYTGALARQMGRFEVADGSTIFLDEIGELPLELQAKLLHVLERGEFERLGSSRTMRVDVRVIAATNRDLTAMVRAGKFREDLFYRLNVFPITVPPLRARLGRRPAAGVGVRARVRPGAGQDLRADSQAHDGGAAALRLAGQRAGAAQRDRAGDHPESRSDPARRAPGLRRSGDRGRDDAGGGRATAHHRGARRGPLADPG